MSVCHSLCNLHCFVPVCLRKIVVALHLGMMFETYPIFELKLAQCALSLRVNCDLKYVISEHSFPAKHLVRHNLIRMLPSAFMGRAFYATLKRVEKYILRGFSW